MPNPTFNIQSGTIVKVSKSKFKANVNFKTSDGLKSTGYIPFEVDALSLSDANKILSRAAWEFEKRVPDTSVIPNVPTNTDIPALNEDQL